MIAIGYVVTLTPTWPGQSMVREMCHNTIIIVSFPAIQLFTDLCEYRLARKLLLLLQKIKWVCVCVCGFFFLSH